MASANRVLQSLNRTAKTSSKRTGVHAIPKSSQTTSKMMVPIQHRRPLNLKTTISSSNIPAKTASYDGIAFGNGNSSSGLPPFQSGSKRNTNAFISANKHIAFFGGASFILSWILMSDDDGV